MKRIAVNTAKSYDIVIANGFDSLLSELSPLFSQNSAMFIITDLNVGALYGEMLIETLRRGYERVLFFTVEAGENSKNINVLSLIFDFLLANGADRGSVIIALGGGVVGDLAGFAAATYMRGISCVQVPTTLLAQVDSSIGGKTAGDFGGCKNIIGAFYQPRLVYINIETLNTLPKCEFSSGLAEVLKYGLILDSEFYRYLISNIEHIHDSEILEAVVAKCIELKAAVVEVDENDNGIREILNFGHTVGHAVESLKQFELLHGECVGLGSLASMEISRKRGMLEAREIAEYRSLLKAIGLPVDVCGISLDEIFETMQKDKKFKSGKISFVLLRKIGNALRCGDIENCEIMDALRTITIGG